MSDADHRSGNSEQTLFVQVQDLVKHFDASRPFLNRLLAREGRQVLKAVDGVSFDIPKGKTFSLVGESGCGKSTIARCIVGLYRPTRGSVLFDGVNLAQLSDAEVMLYRRRFQMIFQDPYASLNPRWRVESIIAEPIREHRLITGKKAIRDRVDELLIHVRMTPRDKEKYPHEFSGGQRQRISIARALASNPEFVVCDEPTSALDVSVQAQILNLMRDLQQEFGLTYLFISHNLAVVHHVSDFVGVMYLGRLVEAGDARGLFRSPLHPYTRMLLDTIPSFEVRDRNRQQWSGEVPNPITPPPGCHYHPRCPYADRRCQIEEPKLILIDGRQVTCHAVEEGRIQPGAQA